MPQTYLARFFILDDVFHESTPGCDPFCNLLDILSIFKDRFRLLALPREDHLKSRYLVFSSNFHGDLEAYLRGMWSAISADIKHIWEHCVAFDKVHDAEGFITYIKRCQLTANLFFMGSTDDPLEEQLKALYLKQQFVKRVSRRRPRQAHPRGWMGAARDGRVPTRPSRRGPRIPPGALADTAFPQRHLHGVPQAAPERR